MWDLVSFMLAMGVLILIVNYWMDPKQLIEDVKSLKQSDSRIDELERRVAEMEKMVDVNHKQTSSDSRAE